MKYELSNELADEFRPSTWVKYKESMCDGCEARCCRLPVEVNTADLVRLGVMTEDEAAGSLKKVARRLEKEGIVRYYRERTGLMTLAQRQDDECVFLGPDKRCTVYERRPDVCRNFPKIGPRPDFCPARHSMQPKFGR